MNIASLKENRVVLVVFAILQTVAFGGIMYGWAGVAGGLLIAHPSQGGAGLTLDQTTNIFAMLASVSSFSPLLLGIVLDKYGPRTTTFLSNIIVGIGIQILACARSYIMFAIGACTIAFGGPGIQASVVSFCNLFPENQFFVLSLISGSISASFAILPIFEMMWERYGIGYRTMFQSFIGVVVLGAVGSLLLMPNKPFEDADNNIDDGKDELLLHDSSRTPPASPQSVTPFIYAPSPERLVMESTQHFTHLAEQPLNSFLRKDPKHELTRHASFALSKKAIEKGQLSYVSLKDLPFMQQVTSGSYIRSLIVFVTTCFFANFYIATITTEFADFVDEYTIEEQHEMTNTFSLVLSFGILGSFFAGWLMDTVGLETCTLVTLALGILHMATLLMFGNEHVMILGYVIYTLFRQFLFPIFIALISNNLGFKYFGILFGIGFAVSGVTQLFIAPLAQVVQGTCHLDDDAVENCSHGKWKELHVYQIVILTLLGVLPIWDHRVQMKVEEKVMLEIPRNDTSPSSSTYGSVVASPKLSIMLESEEEK